MTERRTRFDAYAAGRADGEADRAAGREEPREDLGAGWPGHLAAYGSGYFESFGREGRSEERLPPPPLALDLVGAVAEAAVGAWAARRPSRWSWQVWVAGGVAAVGGQYLRAWAQRRRERGTAPGSVPPVLLAPGRIARNLGVSSAWWIMRRRRLVGEGFATLLGRNLAWLVVLRIERRADERRWRDYQR